MLYSVKAAQELISQDMDFDVILCDIIMPEMTGIDFYQWMEKHRPNLVPHIIFMTGGTLSLESKAFLESIANPFFSKPIDSQELRNFVRERVKFRIQSREAACSEVEKSNHESNTAS
jgi:DNA-binding NtrC family response regulator